MVYKMHLYWFWIFVDEKFKKNKFGKYAYKMFLSGLVISNVVFSMRRI